MKTISKSIGYLHNIERYDLCNIPSKSINCSGLAICYTLATYGALEFKSLDLKARHEEIGVVEGWHRKYSRDYFNEMFDKIDTFLERFNCEDFGEWTLTVIYQGTEIIISGERDNSKIGLSYSASRVIDIEKLLKDVEHYIVTL